MPHLAEPIPGYTITERIGAGGYGEVWRAEAPGGLSKAIKFVFGCLEGERAGRELKALQRIREVRHPFLLSLERIEVVDGQLVILTELADGSVKDRFQACRELQKPGIPREELLVYLHDAAEALDYMSEQHGLQHLDVKPENLLIVGGRVKVADFGLVKEIRDQTVSLLGGLTPVYAAPESFGGHPSRHSDQYSLAIVYQEMLTGSLPFPGKTAAQLMAQHLYNRPRFATLPAADQPALARALSKEPDERFPNCRSLIESLLAAGRVPEHSGGLPSPGPASVSSPSIPTPTELPTRGTDTDEPAACPASWGGEHPPTLATLCGLDDPVEAHRPTATEVPLPQPAVVDLPPLPFTPGAVLRPTLFLGIGGTGGRVLHHLHHRLIARTGNPATAPAIQFLLLDTDTASLARSVRDEALGGLDARQTLPMPLRPPQEYREQSERLLRWLSRRWLYNIPRTLQTEGIRPLGRLAFVDHAAAAMRQIRTSLETIVRPEALSATAAAFGIEETSAEPRVVVVASISGGAGSGMALDVGYAVRKILTDLGLSPAGLLGLLTHSTLHNPSAKDLALANALACLAELEHYGKGHYPGDPSCGLPICSAPPFQSTYIVHLGDGLDERQYAAAVDSFASYLDWSAFGEAGPWFDACREPRRDAVRTFAFATPCRLDGDAAAAAAERLSANVIRRWCGDEPPGRTASPKTARAGSAPADPTGESPLTLDLDQLVRQAAGIIESVLGGDPESCLRAKIDRLENQDPATPERILGAINAAIGDRGEPPEAGGLQSALAREVQHLVHGQGADLCRWITDLTDSSPVRLEGARLAAQWTAERLRGLETEADARWRQTAVRLSQMEKNLLEGDSPRGRGGWLGIGRVKRRVLDVPWTEYFRLRLDQAAIRSAMGLVRTLRSQVVAAGDRLNELRRRLQRWREQFDDAADALEARRDLDQRAARQAESWRALAERLNEIAARLDQDLQESWFAQHGGLPDLLAENPDRDKQLLAALRAKARKAVAEAFSSLQAGQHNAGDAEIESLVAAAAPQLSECGGGRRYLLVRPDERDAAWADAIGCRLPAPPQIVPGGSEPVLCCEMENLRPRRVIEALAGDRRDCLAIAARLRTRTDVVLSSE